MHFTQNKIIKSQTIKQNVMDREPEEETNRETTEQGKTNREQAKREHPIRG
jgi:hypothetical protein